MHLDEKETELLKQWIIKDLEGADSTADSDVLADYVLALLGSDEPEPLAKQNCLDNLKDFLPAHAEGFVNGLFMAIATKSYDPSRPAQKPAKIGTQLPQPHVPSNSSSQRAARKRSFNDWNERDQPNEYWGSGPYMGNTRPIKQLRRSGRGFDQRGVRHSHATMPGYPRIPTPPPGLPPFDANDPMAAMMAMQQALQTFAGAGYLKGSQISPPRAIMRCRDYDVKGFCAAGVSCPYEHGDSHVVSQISQEYDPTDAALLNVIPSRTGDLDDFDSSGRRGTGKRGRGRGRSNYRSNGRRSELAHVGPNRDRSNSSIVVERIPQEKFDEQSIRGFFSDFGTIDEVTMRPDQNLAILQFHDHTSAQSAYNSPKSVFDNRFVKVYWHRPEKSSKQPNGHANSEVTEDNQAMDEAREDQIDMVEVAKRQEEAQRRHDELKRQQEEAAKRKEEVDEKLKAMEVSRKAMADRIARKSGVVSSPSAEPPSADEIKNNAQTQALKEQLAKLEAEAKSLGIDPDAPTITYSGYSSFRGRGSYRGYGRGRGAFRGARGRPPGGAVMRLDNRPKTVAVSFPGGKYEDYDEALRQFLLFNSLEPSSIAKHPEQDDAATVTFSQRYEAENFMAAARNGLLHVGKVEMAWYIPKFENSERYVHDGSGDDMNIVENKETITAVQDVEIAAEEDLDRWS